MKMPGSQTIDFVVWTKPTPHVFKLDGKYWHTMRGAVDRDFLNDMRVKKAFDHNVIIHHINLDDNPIESVDDAVKIIREEMAK